MENLTDQELLKNKKLVKSLETMGTEALLYFYARTHELIKCFVNDEANYLKNKEYVIDELLKYQQEIRRPFLILPTRKLYVKGCFRGVVYP